MRFWDSSAVIPLILDAPVAEAESLRRMFQVDAEVGVWWGTTLECVSAFVRMERDGALAVTGLQRARARLAELYEEVIEVPPTGNVRDRAERILYMHRLKAADAMQLAAALTAAQERPQGFGFVCLDRRLREAAAREGFAVLPE